MTTKLDVTSLPRECLYGKGEPELDLAGIVTDLRNAVEDLAHAELIKHNASFGFAMANPAENYHEVWDRPEKLVWFVAGWGVDRDRYIANAVRKMRAAARQNHDTLSLGHDDFNLTVESQEPDGSFAWGDFPYGGAAFAEIKGYRLLGGVSCLTEVEDHAVASLILGLVGAKMLERDSA